MKLLGNIIWVKQDKGMNERTNSLLELAGFYPAAKRAKRT